MFGPSRESWTTSCDSRSDSCVMKFGSQPPPGGLSLLLLPPCRECVVTVTVAGAVDNDRRQTVLLEIRRVFKRENNVLMCAYAMMRIYT